jgi:hypothetical protein
VAITVAAGSGTTTSIFRMFSNEYACVSLPGRAFGRTTSLMQLLIEHEKHLLLVRAHVIALEEALIQVAGGDFQAEAC